MKKDYIKCPQCKGTGYREVGRSIAMQRAIDCGFPATYKCECCDGTGSIHKNTDPDWWRPSDLGGR